ncbi:hypothetical protein GJ654_10390 [Rhodoblastus acidophilus]|uniref:Uncharacterized protein n=1 Tax=Rhodoblastus acidophilus TaxID=1074 RepID=A0A6N8DLD1_RHOAC|nr:hypothetical protein [Rhodoblastus acidophilus]MCW2275133.1 hypothetical protein [Rhodoblastus acidophilus]MTV31402.1 hypothetical protein [Rhodoblastus acidophilus]
MSGDKDDVSHAIRAGEAGFAKKLDEQFGHATGRGKPGEHGKPWTFDTDGAVLPAVEGYEPLRRALQAAFEQSAYGKGNERHANGKPFDEQPIMEIVRLFGQAGIVGHAYQIIKKAQEAGNMALRGKTDAARAEFLGVIVYAAAAWNYLGSDAFCVPEASE